jgi:hypothetical protein
MMLAIGCVAYASSAVVMGSDRAPQSPEVAADVVLQADGTLTGQFVDEQGRPMDGAVVLVSQDQRVIASTTTDAQGLYHCRLPRGGVYRITAGSCSRDFRVWAPQVAPPGAKTHATLVRTNAVVRGNVGCDGTGMGCADGGLGCSNALGIVGATAGVAGLVVGGIALGKANDAEDDVAELRAIINSISP